MNNMNMWPPSVNPTVQPPAVKQLPGRPSKARRKEANETKRTGKLSKCGAAMTCSNCHTKGHNKRGCPIPPTPDQIMKMLEKEEGPRKDGCLKEARRTHRQCFKEEEEEGPREGGCLKKAKRTHRQCIKEETDEEAPKEGECLKEDKKMKTQATEERCLTKTK
ncbi:hypothetical protein KY289_017978 [Solanum tuberosum]|nr:hypothetical protein KY284_017819 [Solanum tuberosum]KAH0690620.1 hypothetical protein KY289_017978 [Solanum tuberosum]